MPEHVDGQSSVPISCDTEQWFKDTLARVEDKLDVFAATLAALAAELAEVREAEAILRRAAAAPDRPRRASSPRRGRRGDTYLRVV